MRQVAQMLTKLLLIANGQMVWRAAIAGLCGSVTHTLLMLGKAKLGILEPFQPYQSLQIALSYWSGEYVHPLLPWVLSYVNGSSLAGFAFAGLYWHLPGASGPAKGFIAGVLGWLAMNLIFFPLLGLGLFVTHLGLGPWPAVFSLGMMLAYSVVMGIVYSMIYSATDRSPGGLAWRVVRVWPAGYLIPDHHAVAWAGFSRAWRYRRSATLTRIKKLLRSDGICRSGTKKVTLDPREKNAQPHSTAFTCFCSCHSYRR
jgi:hypothetical protein